MKRLMGGLVAALLVGPAWAGDLDDAADLRAEGHLEEAAAKYRSAAADPANHAAAIGLSETLALLGRVDEAATALDAALAKDPTSAPLLIAKTRALVQGAEAAAARRVVDVVQWPEAIAKATDARKCVDALLELDPKSVPGRVLDARILRIEQRGDTAEVRRRLEVVIADAPGDADANFQLGSLLFRWATEDNKNKELWAAAEKRFRATCAADPANGMAIFQAARSAAWQGRYAGYGEDLEKAALLLPGIDEPLVSLESYLKKNPKGRVAAFQRVLEKRPDDSNVVFHLALALNDLGRDDEATQLLEAQRAKRPQSAMLSLQETRLLLAAGKRDAAYDAALRTAALCKGDADRPAYDGLDALLIRTTQFTPEQADEVWSALLAALPREVQAPNNAGLWFRDRQGDPAASLRWFLRAVEIAPDDVMLLNDVGISYAGSRPPDSDKAEEYYRRAIAAARKRGIAKPGVSKGCDLATRNLVQLLHSQKDAQALLALAEEFEDDPRHDSIVQVAESLKR